MPPKRDHIATAAVLAADATRKPDKAGRPTKAELRAAAKAVRERFLKARNAEHGYARRLRKIADHVGEVVRAYSERGWVHSRLAELTDTLQRYAVVIEPWARAVASRMLAEVARRDERAWRQAAASIGEGVRAEIAGADTGVLMRDLLAEQVRLIKSLPLEAAQRVHELATEMVHTGGRAEGLARAIYRTGHVTRSRADLIARTETSRAQSLLTQARAQHLGSTLYVWRTARDANVREAHAKLEGTTHAWNAPPVAGSQGERANPGCIYNCRCWAEPIID